MQTSPCSCPTIAIPTLSFLGCQPKCWDINAKTSMSRHHAKTSMPKHQCWNFNTKTSTSRPSCQHHDVPMLLSQCCHLDAAVSNATIPKLPCPAPPSRHCHLDAAVPMLPSQCCHHHAAIIMLPYQHYCPNTTIPTPPSQHCSWNTAITMLQSSSCHSDAAILMPLSQFCHPNISTAMPTKQQETTYPGYETNAKMML